MLFLSFFAGSSYGNLLWDISSRLDMAVLSNLWSQLHGTRMHRQRCTADVKMRRPLQIMVLQRQTQMQDSRPARSASRVLRPVRKLRSSVRCAA